MLTDVYQHAQQLATPLATAVVEGLQLQISGINLGPQPMQAVYPPAGGVPWAVPHYEGGYDAAPGYGAADGGNYGAEWYPDGEKRLALGTAGSRYQISDTWASGAVCSA